MDVLLIGGTRFLGPLVAMRLLAAGHRVTVLNRGTRPDPFGAFQPWISGLVADRRSPELARVLDGRRFDAVVDFAAYESTDVEGAVRALRGRMGHYLLISTGQVYLVREGCPVPARETDYDGPLLPRPTEPHDRGQWEYGIGKRACEDRLREAWEEERFPATRLRIPVVLGERDHNRRLDGYLFRLLDGGPILVPDGGHVPMRPVYGGEVARAVTAILGRADTFGEAFNLCQGETLTLRELLGILAEHVGATPRLVDVSSATLQSAGLAPSVVSHFSRGWMSVLDPAKATATLAFQHLPVRDYLARIVASFLAYPPGEPPPGYAERARERQLVE